ncbi:MAG TPA: LuxR C-terminal-related transcriptional regulator [Arsenicitalea sp.]|jgi:DNA-binding CsgD family transcriptional regulator|nr:LuxR C-terminal-related transcriptional regulator [Arsenicitalea sp.]
MLAILERHLQAIHDSQSDTDLVKVLADAADAFGFRSAHIIEYASTLSGLQNVLDTDPVRRSWWPEYFAGSLRPPAVAMRVAFDAGPLLWFDEFRFGPELQALRVAFEKYDLLQVATIPISHEGELVGVAGFSGRPKLDKQQEMALQLISYTMYAQARSFRQHRANKDVASLTPREKEVIQLSSEGLTSQEIAVRLGMSARTANQHIDNVADKLGTKNRAHTVAEVIRHNLLN